MELARSAWYCGRPGGGVTTGLERGPAAVDPSAALCPVAPERPAWVRVSVPLYAQPHLITPPLTRTRVQLLQERVRRSWEQGGDPHALHRERGYPVHQRVQVGPCPHLHTVPGCAPSLGVPTPPSLTLPFLTPGSASSPMLGGSNWSEGTSSKWSRVPQPGPLATASSPGLPAVGPNSLK